MSQNVGAKFKGWIKNNDTNEKKSFQFNPTTFQYARGATYTEISAPGMSYPNTQFVKGGYQTFTVTLYMYDNPCTNQIRIFEKFLNGFLPPQRNSKNSKRPPSMTFCMGQFIKKCVLENLDVLVSRYDEAGKATEASFTLQLKQVGA